MSISVIRGPGAFLLEPSSYVLGSRVTPVAEITFGIRDTARTV